MSTVKNNENLSLKLKEIREKHFYTQSAFARKFNISPRSLSYYESGVCSPPIDFLLSVCDFENISLDSLFNRPLFDLDFLSLSEFLSNICMVTDVKGYDEYLNVLCKDCNKLDDNACLSCKNYSNHCTYLSMVIINFILKDNKNKSIGNRQGELYSNDIQKIN